MGSVVYDEAYEAARLNDLIAAHLAAKVQADMMEQILGPDHWLSEHDRAIADKLHADLLAMFREGPTA